MKNSDGAYIQAHSAQAVVDAEHQVITAADVTTNPSDALNCTTMLGQSAQNTGVHPKQALVDAGYCSETNLQAAKDRQLAAGPTRSWLPAAWPTTNRYRPHRADGSLRTPR
jgi:hypothetical protein